MQVWNMLHAARWKCRTQKNRHLRTILQLCQAISLQLLHISTIGKKLVKQQFLLQMSPQYGELGLLAQGCNRVFKVGVQFLGLGYSTEQNTDDIPSFVDCSLLHNGNHTLHQKSWGVLSKFWGSGPPPTSGCALVLAAEIGPVVRGTTANFNGFHVLAALLHHSQVVGVSQTLRRWT